MAIEFHFCMILFRSFKWEKYMIMYDLQTRKSWMNFILVLLLLNYLNGLWMSKCFDCSMFCIYWLLLILPKLTIASTSNFWSCWGTSATAAHNVWKEMHIFVNKRKMLPEHIAKYGQEVSSLGNTQDTLAHCQFLLGPVCASPWQQEIWHCQ